MPDPNRDQRKASDPELRAGRSDQTPRWVYAIGAVVTALILLVAILHLTGHALGGHTPPGDSH